MTNEEEVDLGADAEPNEWDSGPYCQHWNDPWDCEVVCSRCGHECKFHGDGSCIGDNETCSCPKFEKSE